MLDRPLLGLSRRAAVFEPDRYRFKYSRNRSRLAIRRCNDDKENPRLSLKTARAPPGPALVRLARTDIVAERSAFSDLLS